MSPNFINYIQPLHSINQILGLAFFSIKNDESFFLLFLKYFCAISFICLYSYCVCKALPVLDTHKAKFDTRDNDYILFFMGVINFYSLIITNLVFSQKIKRQIIFINDNLSGRFGFIVDRNKLKIQLLLVVIFIVVLTTVDVYANEVNDLIHLYFCVNVSIYLNIICIFIIFIYVKQIRNEFELLNEKLQLLFYCKYHENVLKYIIYLLKVHKNLSKLAQKTLDQGFGNIVLINFTLSFLFSIFAVQLFLRYIFLWMEHQNDCIPLAILALFWLLINLGQNFLAVYSWGLLEKEVSLVFH